ncbi:hypothetical protein HPP92_011238 [Vanilla planifolia]|uniref:Uncharacterized protein n=1 Tax=Vanilla planifolia TaxID=51239 RepID=A0A835R2F5_VANPL|nr:hypothetical protein HPP92_011238 [Vanilla planifolia]
MAGNKSAKKHIKKTKEVMLGSSANVINADNRRNEEEIAEEQSIILAVAAQGSKNAQSPKAIQHVGGILSESSESNESSLHLSWSEDEDVNSAGVPMNAIAELQACATEIENAVEEIDARCVGKLISSSRVCNVPSNIENILTCNIVLMSAEYTQNACRNTETTGHEYNQNSESTSEEDQYSNGEKGDVPKHSGEQKFQQNAEMEGVAEYSKGLGPWMLVPRNIQDRRQMNMQRAGRSSGNQQSYASNKSRIRSTSRGRRAEWIPKKTYQESSEHGLKEQQSQQFSKEQDEEKK